MASCSSLNDLVFSDSSVHLFVCCSFYISLIEFVGSATVSGRAHDRCAHLEFCIITASKSSVETWIVLSTKLPLWEITGVVEASRLQEVQGCFSHRLDYHCKVIFARCWSRIVRAAGAHLVCAAVLLSPPARVMKLDIWSRVKPEEMESRRRHAWTV